VSFTNFEENWDIYLKKCRQNKLLVKIHFKGEYFGDDKICQYNSK